jgi:hypothetical protein
MERLNLKIIFENSAEIKQKCNKAWLRSTKSPENP